MSESPPLNDPLDEAFAAYLRSCDTGELSSREEFLAQFPDLAAQLRELMEAADLVGQVALGSASSSSGQPGDETLASHQPLADESGGDPAATLPMPHRAKGDRGPTLPYTLDDYTLLEVLGRGAMGVVYLARQRELDRYVAVKMIRSGILADDAEVRRFYTEAQAAARLNHRGIVAVHQFGRHDGHHFFSMEYIRGTDLQRAIDRGRLEPQRAARYVRDVALAIQHAHENGVLHRDLKPANVLIDEEDEVHVTDFGLAKHLGADSSVTGSGAAVGTPHYMAPEQAGGHSDRVNHQSDVYALGAILFACLTGRPPIVGETVMQTLLQVVHEPAPSVRSLQHDVPVDLETIIAKCLEKKPSQRYESAEKLATELDAFLEDRPIEARPRSVALKAWYWLEGVPLVGALSGRRVLHSTATHRRFQSAMLLLALITPLLAAGLMLVWQHHLQAMPDTVHLAGGVAGGVYHEISAELADRLTAQHHVFADVIDSSGSGENFDLLHSQVVDLAPMQATAIKGDQLCVIAPLFYELLYVLAKVESEIHSIDQLRGHLVAVGPPGSGSLATAELVLESLKLTPDLVTLDLMDWEQLLSADAPDAAMLCVGRGSLLVSNLLADGRWRLVPLTESIQISLRHPALRPMTIEPEEFAALRQGSEPLIPESIPTVGTTAFLAAREDAPAELVVAVLHALYQEPTLYRELIPRQLAAEWQGLAFHPAARRYFEQQAGP